MRQRLRNLFSEWMPSVLDADVSDGSLDSERYCTSYYHVVKIIMRHWCGDWSLFVITFVHLMLQGVHQDRGTLLLWVTHWKGLWKKGVCADFVPIYFKFLRICWNWPCQLLFLCEKIVHVFSLNAGRNFWTNQHENPPLGSTLNPQTM